MKHFYFFFKNKVLWMLVFTTTSLFSQKPMHDDGRLKPLTQKSLSSLLAKKRSSSKKILFYHKSTPAAITIPSCHGGYYRYPNNQLNAIRRLNAKVVNDEGVPLTNQHVFVFSKKVGFWVYTTDSNGNFVIDVNDSFKNLKIMLSLEKNTEIGIDQIVNQREFYIPVNYPNIIRYDLTKGFYYINNELIFTVPSLSFREKELAVKSKFRFRDVKGLNDRYTDIYVRY